MSYLVNKEIKKLKSDVYSSQLAINSDKEIFAAQLRGGLGEDIKNELRNPTKPKLSTSLKIKFSRKLKQLIESWNNLEIKRS